MTGEEFGRFVLEVNATFRGEKIGAESPDDADGAARLAAYRVHLGGLEYETATAAIRLLVEGGQVFVPAAAEVVVAARRLEAPSAPGWAQAWPMIERSLRRDDPDMLPEIVRAFVVSYGSKRLGHEPVNDPLHGGAVLARIGKDYDRFVEDFEDGQRTGRALGQGTARGELRRLDAAASAGIPAAEALARMQRQGLGRKRLAAAEERADSAGPTDDER